MAYSSNLGFPRIGPNRELKRALEAYWSGKSSEEELDAAARSLRRDAWLFHKQAGIDFIPSNDFSLYDHVLDMSTVVGAIPQRYGHSGGPVDKRTYFAMARGEKGDGARPGVAAMEMTKWFDTNYHYIVPEFNAHTRFALSSLKPVEEFAEAEALGVHTRPVLIGPVSYLLLGKAEGTSTLDLLDNLLPVYEELLGRLTDAGADWVQLDEPFLTMDLTEQEQRAFEQAYTRIGVAPSQPKIMLTTYFGQLRENINLVKRLPVAGLHVNARAGQGEPEVFLESLPEDRLLSLGVVDGRNVWKTDLTEALSSLTAAARSAGNERIVVGPSCSMLHAPVDLNLEESMDPEIASWLAYARQKVQEIQVLTTALNEGEDAVQTEFQENRRALASRKTSSRIHVPAVKQRLSQVDAAMRRRSSPFAERKQKQQELLQLPLLPTTTIGSFPQTRDFRKTRAAYRRGKI